MRGGRRDGAGRPAGSKNRSHEELLARIQEQCGDGFDPVLGMAKLAQDELNNLESDASVIDFIKRAREAKPDDLHAFALELKAAIKAEAANRSFALACLAELSQYVHAKRKAVEVTGENGGAVAFEMILPQ